MSWEISMSTDISCWQKRQLKENEEEKWREGEVEVGEESKGMGRNRFVCFKQGTGNPTRREQVRTA